MSSITILNGRLGGDPEIHESKNGKQFYTFSVASDEFKDGNRVTEWFEILAFNDNPFINKVKALKKGNSVIVHGHAENAMYQKLDGTFGIKNRIRHPIYIEFGASSKPQDTSDTQVVSQVQVAQKSVSAVELSCGVLEKPTITPKQEVASVASASSSDNEELPF